MSIQYLMEDERESLRLKHKVNPVDWVNRFLISHVTQYSNILDIGCGPGVIANQLALQSPTSNVYGVDGSQTRLKTAAELNSLANLEFCQADAYSLPFDSDLFDFVYCRFLLEYLKYPPVAILEMHRVCKPGGKVLLQDIDGQLLWHYPIAQALQTQIEIVIDYLEKTGFDPLIGRKLYSYAQNANLKPLKVDIEPYHLYPGRIDNDSLSMWNLKLDIAMPNIVSALGKKSARSFKKAFLNNLMNEETLTYSNLFTVLATKE